MLGSLRGVSDCGCIYLLLQRGYVVIKQSGSCSWECFNVDTRKERDLKGGSGGASNFESATK